ncbi:MAG: hypothetical protein JRI68_33415 [Deltaproteobacteria bacterium]|nr:hypothetical protein [Deltaproteobacteria bacterium]
MSALYAAKYATGLAISVALIVAAGACCEEETKQSGLPTTSSSTTSTGGGAGGSTSGTGGSTSSTSGTAGGGGISAADEACIGDFAFRAAGMAFTEPTAAALAAALSELTYSGEEHPITVVLRSSDPNAATIGASVSVYDDQTYTDSFATGLEPTFSPTDAIVELGSFGTASAAPMGYLRARHQAGVLDLELQNLSINASTSGGCASAFVILDAVIPASEKSKSIQTSAGTNTIGDLGGGDPNNDLQLRAIFMAETIDFDFSTL